MGGLLVGYLAAMTVAAAFAISCLLVCGGIRLLKLLPLFTLLSVFALGQSGMQATYKGPVTVVHEDPINVTPDNPGIFHYYIDHDGKRDSLGDFTGGPQLGDYQTGTVVEATGVQQNNGSLKNAHIKPPPPAPQISISGAQSTLAIVFNFSDYTLQPFTPAVVASALSTASNFVLENSYETAWLTPTVVGYVTIPDSIGACNTTQMATDAKSAATAAGINVSNYSHYVYVFPFDNACAFAGLSDIGGSPSESWINGFPSEHTLQHELGHAFGLFHSHSLDCGSTLTVCSNGSVIEYGDEMDTMGTSADWSPDFTAFQKQRLGWLALNALPAIQTVSSSGQYTFSPLEIQDTTTKALKILKSTDSTTGAKTWYYLEQRQALGFDAFLSNNFPFQQNVTTSVLLHLGTDSNGNSSELIDITPATSTTFPYFDFGLPVGQTYTDSAAGFSVTPTSITGTSTTVSVNFGATQSGSISCTAHPLAASYTAGNTSSIDIHVTDNSGNVVSGASVTQVLRKTNAATTTQSCSSNSGGDAVCTYKIKTPDPLGTWQATETVTQGTLSTSCNTNFLVN